MSNVDLAAVEEEIDQWLEVNQREFLSGFDLSEILARSFLRLSPEAMRVLCVRGAAATMEHKMRAHVCDACGAEIEE